MWVTNSLLLQEKCWTGSFFPIMCHRAMGGAWDMIMSLSLLPISMWFFSPLLGRTAPVVFRYMSEGHDPSEAVDLVCLWEEMSLGLSPHRHLVDVP